MVVGIPHHQRIGFQIELLRAATAVSAAAHVTVMSSGGNACARCCLRVSGCLSASLQVHRRVGNRGSVCERDIAMRHGAPGVCAITVQVVCVMETLHRRMRPLSAPAPTRLYCTTRSVTDSFLLLRTHASQVNDAAVSVGDLVLVDAASEFWGYASDITRTWPASGVYVTCVPFISNAGWLRDHRTVLVDATVDL